MVWDTNHFMGAPHEKVKFNSTIVEANKKKLQTPYILQSLKLALKCGEKKIMDVT